MTTKPDKPVLIWERGADVVPFPLVRRLDLIERTARDVAFRGHKLGSRDPAATGEKLLVTALRTQRTIMERRGVDPEVIERELSQFELAVRLLAVALEDDTRA